MALAHCILGKFLGVGCHCFPPPLDVPTFSAKCLHVQRRGRPLAAEGGTLRGREMFRQILSRIRLPRNSRDFLHATNLRHGTDGFTSPPKEGVLRIYLLHRGKKRKKHTFKLFSEGYFSFKTPKYYLESSYALPTFISLPLNKLFKIIVDKCN